MFTSFDGLHCNKQVKLHNSIFEHSVCIFGRFSACFTENVFENRWNLCSFVQFCAVFRYLFNDSGLIVRIFNFYMRIYGIFGKF
jgi:hypothetical protein